MIGMTLTNPNSRLHLLLQHVLVACTIVIVVKIIYVKKMFDHIASQNVFVWGVVVRCFAIT